MTPSQFIKAYPDLLAKHGSQREVSKKLGIARSTMQSWLANQDAIIFRERKPAPPVVVKKPRPSGKTRRFIFTSAQDETAVHLPFLRNLEAYASYLGAELVIAGFTYNKSLFEDHNKKARRVWFADEVLPYLTNDRINIGDNLTFAGEMNTLPTATTPLSGFETYTRGRSGIFPHAKVQLVSIPTMKDAPAKQIMTTGAVTKRNYIQKRAGIKASFHHIIGAVIVELDSSGDHFCRHLIAEEDTGNFYDLTRYVADGEITDGHRVQAITHGDIHHENIDPIIARATWGLYERDTWGLGRMAQADSMMQILRPQYQFLHDTSDFDRRNHHNIKDPIFRFKKWVKGEECIEDSYRKIAEFLAAVDMSWCQTIVVASNHDEAGVRWLHEADWRHDPVNAEFYLKAQLAHLKSVRSSQPFSLLKWAVGEVKPADMARIIFLHEDQSFMVCGIEQGMHGHLGANGAKGSPRQFTRAGPKSNTGHTHSAGILDGAYVAGTKSKLSLGYNKGLSSWSHTDILTYANGSRTLVTMTPGGKWCAE